MLQKYGPIIYETKLSQFRTIIVILFDGEEFRIINKASKNFPHTIEKYCIKAHRIVKFTQFYLLQQERLSVQYT